jgi:hypothetical protein
MKKRPHIFSRISVDIVGTFSTMIIFNISLKNDKRKKDKLFNIGSHQNIKNPMHTDSNSL